MLKNILSLLFCFIILSCTPKNETTINKYNFTADKLKHSSVLILDKINDAVFAGKCGGVWIDKFYFVTAYHCVKEKKLAYYLTWNDVANHPYLHGKYLISNTAQVIATNKQRDLALLKADTSKYHYFVHIYTGTVYPGMNLHLIGHPYVLDFTYATAIVSSVREVVNPLGFVAPLIQVHGPATNGYSGCGAFDDNGNLIGITSFKYDIKVGLFLTMYVPSQAIINLLNSAQTD